MNYLEHFHFDNYPFTEGANINYFYPKKSFLKIIDEMIKFCRFQSGIFVISGKIGVGKTIVLNKILEAVSNNDFVISTCADEKTELLKIIANKLEIDSQNISEILINLSKIYSYGKNVIITIDNAENLSKDEYISLSSLVQVLPNLRVILCGNKSLHKKLNQKAIKSIKKHIVKEFKIKHLSILGAMKYISYMEKNALALSQYKKVFSLPSIFLISIFSNMNIRNINIISEKVLINAFEKNQTRAKVKNAISVIGENFDITKDNIYHKFQKLFLYALLILSCYYTIKIISDRNDLINHIEAQKSIRQQEEELKDSY